jgi:hypothetical protein
MEKPIYQSTVEFYYFNRVEGNTFPKGTVFYPEILSDEYVGIHYDLKKPVRISSNFFEENKIVRFNEVSHEYLNGFMIFIEAIRLLRYSKMNKEEMIEELSKALGFLAFSDTDFEDIDKDLDWPENELFNQKTEKIDEYVIGKSPVTAYTWSWSSSGAHSTYKYD